MVGNSWVSFFSPSDPSSEKTLFHFPLGTQPLFFPHPLQMPPLIHMTT